MARAKERMHSRHVLPLGLLAVLLLGGCAGTGGDPYRDAEVVRALGLEHEDLERPGLLDELFARRAARAEEARARRLQALEAALEAAEGARPADRSPVGAGAVQPRLGLWLHGPGSERLERRLQAAAPDYPLRLLGDAAVRQALAEHGCDQPLACAAALRRDPGLRLVLELRSAEQDPRLIWVRLHDLELEAKTERRRYALPDGPDGIPRAALDALAEQLLLAASDRLHRLPVFARPLERTEVGHRINAGAADGLEPGTLLAVHRPGRVVRGAEGAAAYLLGEHIGTARVLSVEGPHRAVVALEDGQGPGMDDLLLPLRP